jgi:hypothetical protein
MNADTRSQIMAEGIKQEKIRRAMLAGPSCVTMLNGAAQHSFTDPFDRTSPAIPIGPHWMLIWPFDAKAAGIGTNMRDGGTMVMFAGTPYAHLHICGSPWDGHEYQPGDRGAWTMTYSRP